jgi:hypothetical protein
VVKPGQKRRLLNSLAFATTVLATITMLVSWLDRHDRRLMGEWEEVSDAAGSGHCLWRFGTDGSLVTSVDRGGGYRPMEDLEWSTEEKTLLVYDSDGAGLFQQLWNRIRNQPLPGLLVRYEIVERTDLKLLLKLRDRVVVLARHK